jgi:hypothetical protein
MDLLNKEIQDKLAKLAKIQESNRKAIKKHLDGKKQQGYIQVSAFILSQNKAKLDLIKQVYNHKNYNQTLDLLIDSFNLEYIKPIQSKLKDTGTDTASPEVDNESKADTKQLESITLERPTNTVDSILNSELDTCSPEADNKTIQDRV